jgi:hypothetical protein
MAWTATGNLIEFKFKGKTKLPTELWAKMHDGFLGGVIGSEHLIKLVFDRKFSQDILEKLEFIGNWSGHKGWNKKIQLKQSE